MKRILQVNVDDNGLNGVYAFVMNILRNVGHDVSIDLCAFEKFQSESNMQEIHALGGTVHYCGYQGNIFIKQWTSLRNYYRLISQNGYDVVHVHSDVAYKLFLYAFLAKLGGVPNILIHSHATGIDGKHRRIKWFLHHVAKPLLPLCTDVYLACSRLAGRWMYDEKILNGKDFSVIYNGIDVAKFSFDEGKRKKKRQELNLQDEVVIGHIGRFAYQKNHAFLIAIFKEIVNIKGKAVLMLIGDYIGDDYYWNEAKRQVSEYGLDDCVRFMGLRKDVPDLMQAMDVFLLPSRFEGLPIAGVEAQAAGLPCFFSSEITEETKLSSRAYFLSLQDAPAVWAKRILEELSVERKKADDEIEAAGYDVRATVRFTEKLYSMDKGILLQ